MSDRSPAWIKNENQSPGCEWFLEVYSQTGSRKEAPEERKKRQETTFMSSGLRRVISWSGLRGFLPSSGLHRYLRSSHEIRRKCLERRRLDLREGRFGYTVSVPEP